MSLVASDFPEDSAVVLAEVIAHLATIDRRRLADHHELAAAWSGVSRCDSAVLEILTPVDRASYEIITRAQPRGWRQGRRTAESSLRVRVARLHVAIHRRLVLLQDIAPHSPWLL